jgi:DNA-binding CsgD family transcriptional regulator
MSVTENDLDRVRLLLLEAGEDPSHWPAALTAFAEACGGFAGQLIARDGEDGLLFQLVTNIDPEWSEIAEAHGLGDVSRNPRLAIGRRAPLMTAVVDHELVDADARKRHSIYPALYDRFDVPFNAQAVLHRTEDLMLRTSISRSATQGPLEGEDVRVFESLLPYVRAAARQQFAAERRSLETLLHASDAAGAAVFVLNRFGVLIGASEAGEAELRNGEFLKFDDGGVASAGAREAIPLQHAIASALSPWRGDPFGGVQEIKIEGRLGEVLTIRISTFPLRPFALGGEPAVLIEARRGGVAAASLQTRFRLTKAEAEVASLLASGASTAEVAAKRGVSVETVRAQVKALFGKIGVSTRGALVAHLRG